MPYCPQCGRKVDELATFCPNCGASLKPEQPEETEQPVKQAQVPRTRSRTREERRERRAELRARRREEKEEEKSEKSEKSEKEEKHEKHEKKEKEEKHEPTVAGLLAGGFIIFSLGVVFYLEIMGYLSAAVAWPLWWVAVFIVMISLAAYGARLARKRHPKA